MFTPKNASAILRKASAAEITAQEQKLANFKSTGKVARNESRVIAAQKAIEEGQNQGQGDNEQSGDGEGKKSDLLCFDSEGSLTDDRSRCDREQGKFIRGGDGNISEQKAREEIRKEFLGTDVEDRRRANLLESMNDAQRRIAVLRDGMTIPVLSKLGRRLAGLL